MSVGELQKIKKNGHSGFLSLLFPCPRCGRRNRVAGSKAESLRLLQADELGSCKGCGAALEAELYGGRKIISRGF